MKIKKIVNHSSQQYHIEQQQYLLWASSLNKYNLASSFGERKLQSKDWKCENCICRLC